MTNNELIKREYILAIEEFQRALGEIDKKYNTFAKVGIDFDTVYRINSIYPAHYIRNIKLEEVIIK